MALGEQGIRGHTYTHTHTHTHTHRDTPPICFDRLELSFSIEVGSVARNEWRERWRKMKKKETTDAKTNKNGAKRGDEEGEEFRGWRKTVAGWNSSHGVCIWSSRFNLDPTVLGLETHHALKMNQPSRSFFLPFPRMFQLPSWFIAASSNFLSPSSAWEGISRKELDAHAPTYISSFG